MADFLQRTELLLGEKNMAVLQNMRVAVLGLGGVGCAAAEALCRAGIGHLLLIDSDTVDITNLNRQIFYTQKDAGVKKAKIATEHLRAINPSAEITAADYFYLPENSGFLYDFAPDYVIDAIDTVTAKLHLAASCKEKNIKLLCCLGTGNRLNPQRLKTGDISETAGSFCPLARVMRRELKKRGVDKLRVVYSDEPPLKALASSENGRHSPGSISFVPPVAGYLLAAELINDIIEI
ncbi:MAG: tRNA threonylcarbamoyladenosine dehydratase [Hydrogenoanaerobacterium sp.]